MRCYCIFSFDCLFYFHHSFVSHWISFDSLFNGFSHQWTLFVAWSWPTKTFTPDHSFVCFYFSRLGCECRCLCSDGLQRLYFDSRIQFVCSQFHSWKNDCQTREPDRRHSYGGFNHQNRFFARQHNQFLQCVFYLYFSTHVCCFCHFIVFLLLESVGGVHSSFWYSSFVAGCWKHDT